MASFKAKEVISILQKLGYFCKRQTGSHLIMFNPEIKKIIAVPMHNRDLKRGLILGIIKQVGSTEKEFLRMK